MKKWVRGIYYGLFTGVIFGLISFLTGEICQRFLGSEGFEACRMSIFPFYLLSRYFSLFSETIAISIAIIIIMVLFTIIGAIVGFYLDRRKR